MRKKCGYFLMIMAVATIFVTCGSVMAETYKFKVLNNLDNPINSNNENATCFIRFDAATGAGINATAFINSLAAGEEKRVALTSDLCNVLHITTSCSFKDYQGNPKVEEKNITSNCTGAEVILGSYPIGEKWTSYTLLFCPPGQSCSHFPGN